MPNIPNNIQNVIKEFIDAVNGILGNRIKQYILYGSYARGDYEKNSDIDIMILTDLSDEEIIKYRSIIWDLACDIEYENDIILSPVIRNIEKYNQRTNIIPFYINVQKEGVILHG